ncbi:MAG TPA: type II toxin-antitoxin system death-on-curing family toxin [Methylocystis sp.]|nr:type II toxin-antitoxin system death-on-curing family toxin [Methylocystis sp.]
MAEPVWVLRTVVDAMHDAQLVEHGGKPGLRDAGLLDSALARPRNRHACGEVEPCALAAAYASGIARNHPFVDGNKRTAFLAAYVFLRSNGLELVSDEVNATAAMLALASGQLAEQEFADWLRAKTKAAHTQD